MISILELQIIEGTYFQEVVRATTYSCFFLLISFLFSSTEGSAKVIGNELRALTRIIDCTVTHKISDLYFPLACVVDWRGFRIYGSICSSFIQTCDIITDYHNQLPLAFQKDQTNLSTDGMTKRKR